MIRKVNLTEINACTDVIKKSFVPVAVKFNISEENSPNYVAFSITSEKLKNQYCNGREMYVYLLEEHIVGYFSLNFYDNVCELNNLCVLPEYQHNGIGKELLTFAIQRAINKKSDKLTLSIVEENSEFKEWYSSFGFIHTHIQKYDQFSFTCGYMELKL